MLLIVAASGPKEFFQKPGQPVRRFVFFISSGSDMNEQRDLFEGLVKEANQQFRLREDQSRAFSLEVDRWEHDAPRRTTEMNAEFVSRAKQSDATVVLLSTEVRSGTREEIEGVLAAQDVQLSVIWMEQPESKNRSRPLKKYLNDKSDCLAYHRTGPPGSRESILALFRVVTAALADLTNGDRREALFNEER